MLTTRATLISRAKSGDSEAWDELYAIYFEWLCDWAEKRGATRQDAEDAASEVLLTLVESIAAFNYDPRQNFRGFLRHVLKQRIEKIKQRRRPATNQETKMREFLEADPHTEDLLDLLMRKEKVLLVHALLPSVEKMFSQKVWLCWEMTVKQGKEASEVARSLGVNLSALYVYKSRVSDKIREVFPTLGYEG